MPIFPSEKVPESKPPKVSITRYNDWRGVDYVHDAYSCSESRCPELLNMISYTRGTLEGRKGYEVVKSFDNEIYAFAMGSLGNNSVSFVHEGSNLWLAEDSNYTLIYELMPQHKTTIFFSQYQEKFLIAPQEEVKLRTIGLILGGGVFLYIDKVDGEITVGNVADIAYKPVVTIAASHTGGGTVLESVNLISPGRIHKAYGDGGNKTFQLPSKNLDSTAVEIIEILADGEQTYTEGIAGNLGFTVDRSTGKITFNSAPPNPPIDGTDNLFITYYKTVEGNMEKIVNCNTVEEFGVGGALRCFVTRNAEYRSYDWWSEPHQPNYFPDLNYGISGNDNTAIVGYLKYLSYLVILKEQNEQDITVYIRTGTVTDEKTYFSTSIGMVGVGAASPYCFTSVLDEPVFLSGTGIYAIVSDAISQQATLQNRSYWLDPKLTNEPDLFKAIAVAWGGFYLLSVNGNTYVLDMRRGEVIDLQKQGVYDGYFWQGFTPTCFLNHGNNLYFGNASGELCRFRDSGTMDDYLDADRAIQYIVKTKQDDDGSGSYRKSLSKKGQSIALKPFSVSTVNVNINTDEGRLFSVNDIVLTASRLWFGYLNFGRVDFNSSTATRPQRLNVRVKKYRSLQFELSSYSKRNTFALVQIEKSFYLTGKSV